jgi:hypothetical protein
MRSASWEKKYYRKNGIVPYCYETNTAHTKVWKYMVEKKITYARKMVSYHTATIPTVELRVHGAKAHAKVWYGWEKKICQKNGTIPLRYLLLSYLGGTIGHKYYVTCLQKKINYANRDALKRFFSCKHLCKNKKWKVENILTVRHGNKKWAVELEGAWILKDWMLPLKTYIIFGEGNKWLQNMKLPMYLKRFLDILLKVPR